MSPWEWETQFVRIPRRLTCSYLYADTAYRESMVIKGHVGMERKKKKKEKKRGEEIGIKKRNRGLDARGLFDGWRIEPPVASKRQDW